MLGTIIGFLVVAVLAVIAIKVLFVVGLLLFHLIGWLFAGTIAVVAALIWIYALIDIVGRQFPNTATKVLWFVGVFCTHIIGAVVYLIFGRRANALYV